MSKKQPSYYAKKVDRAVFQNGEEKLEIVLTEGKKGYNTRATIRKGKDGDPITGTRATFQDKDGGEKAFAKLVKEAKDAGWKESAAGGSRNAFSEIPKPGKAPKI